MFKSGAKACVTLWCNARAWGCGGSWDRLLQWACPQVCQTSGRYQGKCQLADPYNYPITTLLAASELVNATDTSY